MNQRLKLIWFQSFCTWIILIFSWHQKLSQSTYKTIIFREQLYQDFKVSCSQLAILNQVYIPTPLAQRPKTLWAMIREHHGSNRVEFKKNLYIWTNNISNYLNILQKANNALAALVLRMSLACANHLLSGESMLYKEKKYIKETWTVVVVDL